MSKQVGEIKIDLSNEIALAAIEKVLKDYDFSFKSREAATALKIKAIISILRKMDLISE